MTTCAEAHCDLQVMRCSPSPCCRVVKCVEVNKNSRVPFELSLARLPESVESKISWHCADASVVREPQMCPWCPEAASLVVEFSCAEKLMYVLLCCCRVPFSGCKGQMLWLLILQGGGWILQLLRPCGSHLCEGRAKANLLRKSLRSKTCAKK